MNKPLDEELRQLHAEICGALSDPKRIAILYELKDGSRRVTELAENLDLTQVTVSRHLKILREKGLVRSSRDGQNVFYMLTDPAVIKALDLLRQVLAGILQSRKLLATVMEREES